MGAIVVVGEADFDPTSANPSRSHTAAANDVAKHDEPCADTAS